MLNVKQESCDETWSIDNEVNALITEPRAGYRGRSSLQITCTTQYEIEKLNEPG